MSWRVTSALLSKLCVKGVECGSVVLSCFPNCHSLDAGYPQTQMGCGGNVNVNVNVSVNVHVNVSVNVNVS